jgi:hypothetical protein
LLASGLLVVQFIHDHRLIVWIVNHPKEFIGINSGIAVLILLIWMKWDRLPGYLKKGEGRSESRFLDPSEDWAPQEIRDGKAIGPEQPTAVLLAYRDRSRIAGLGLSLGQRISRNLMFISLRWDTLSRHILVIGATGSGKTTSIYGHIMASAHAPWIYQDSKADLPFLYAHPDSPVWGLDVRGNDSRSGLWNPVEEIQTSEDLDLIVDYVFPLNPRDANPWVREMSRTLFAAILKSRRWDSLQDIARSIRQTQLAPFLEALEPIWQDLMKEPKSQVPVLQDIVATLSRWETPRICAITEGRSTVSLDDYIARGGYVMNCEMSDGLRAPVHLFWAMLLGRLRNRAEESSPILLLIDEFGDAGKLQNLERALVLLRSKGVSIIAGIQNLGLLEQVYDKSWKAVLDGFGSRIWLARNLDEGLREKLSRALGKWTRRLPASNSQSKETEKECDLMPLDAWTLWSQEWAVLARMHGYTYWLPYSLPIPATPFGPPSEPEDPWGAQGPASDQVATPGLPDTWPAHLPAIPPDPQQVGQNPSPRLGANDAMKPNDSSNEEDWL